jgi:hypothetical protein
MRSISEGEMMQKGFERNKDWITRDQGRIPTKGARAAERASAGLGTTGNDVALLTMPELPRAIPAKRAPKSPEPDKR